MTTKIALSHKVGKRVLALNLFVFFSTFDKEIKLLLGFHLGLDLSIE